ncbi:hypothetical protein NP284_22610 [Rhodopseudomonas pseudopalustris]|jgi:hypothetical protein|uniref:hypothetical protein n=1 Tax=Rhodopseudomonas pseudopalustris TaxID=1513892 RepID=UPI003F994A0B
MIDRRHLIRLALAAITLTTAAVVPPRLALAEGGYQRFVPLLVELSGWEGGKPEGMTMEVSGASMVTATRNYQRGEAHVDAQMVTGPAAQVALAATSADMKIESGEGRMSSDTIDGFRVMRTYTFSDKSGGIVIALGERALFSLTFSGIDDAEALAIAKRFDWKAMQAISSK